MDDGSTDGTPALLQHFTMAYPGRVKYVGQRNQGKSIALNNAFRHITGEFVAFLDSDDRWSPEKLEWQFRTIERFGGRYPCFTDACYINNPVLQDTAFEFAGQHYKELTGTVPEPMDLFFSTRSGLYIQTLVVPRKLADQVGEFDPALWVGNDTDYMFRLALLSPFCFVNKPLVEIDRTINRDQGLIELMVQDEHLRISEREHLYLKWLELTNGRGEQIRKLLLERLAETHNDWANWHLAHRRYASACKAMSKTLQTQFTVKAALKLAFSAIAPSLARREFLKRESKRSKNRIVT
jgi:glycosyltransferase involved in cell wall biosynthesis